MKRYFIGTQVCGKITIHDLRGKVATKPLTVRDCLIISRDDYMVLFLELPERSAARVEHEIKRKVAGAYPGRMEGACYDFLCERSSRSSHAIVVVMERWLVEEYRRAAGPGKLSVLSALIAGPKHLGVPNGTSTFSLRYEADSYSELLMVKNRRVVSSTLLPTEAKAPEPRRLMLLSVEPEGKSNSAERPDGSEAIQRGGTHERVPVALGLDQVLANHARDAGLFESQGVLQWILSGNGRILGVFALFLLANLTLAALSADMKGVPRNPSTAPQTQANMTTGPDLQKSKLSQLQNEYRRMAALRPRDIYGILSSLRSALQPDEVVLRLVISENGIHLTCLTMDPFGAAHRLSELPYLEEIELESSQRSEDQSSLLLTLRGVLR